MQVDVRSVHAAVEAGGYDELWLRLRTDHDDLGPIVQAAAEADATVREAGLDVMAMTVTPCLAGFGLELGGAFSDEQLDVWVRQITRSLAALGVDGLLEGVDRRWPAPLFAASQPPVPTLFAWFPGAQSGGDWAEVVGVAIPWVLTTPGEVLLDQSGLRLPTGRDGLEEQLVRPLEGAASAGLDVADEACGSGRRASFGPGYGVFQAVDGSPLDQVGALRELAATLAPYAVLAVVRVAQRGVQGLHALDSVQPLGGIQEHHVRQAPELLDHLLPDAHGLQLVSRAHLDAARDLADWEVDDLGGGRSLVAAPDLGPWYAHGTPDPTVLAQGRADWGPALLTPSALGF